MAKSENQKLKLLYLMKIFLEKTDENNGITLAEITKKLNDLDIKAERKSLYSDIELLKEFGLDIETRRGTKFEYYLCSREFQLVELKLLVDAVQSSRFITQKKSQQLIGKISGLTSKSEAKQLKRHLYVVDRPKTINENIYYSVDAINAAINENKKISFSYFDYGTEKEKIYRGDDGEIKEYIYTPLSLHWSGDSYYLIAYNEKYDDPTHYRVDRMKDVQVLADSCNIKNSSDFNLNKHCKKLFGMYNGKTVTARLAFKNNLVNNVLDQFGKDTTIIKDGDRFQVVVDISDSPVFLGWMFQFGNQAEILAPESLKNSMRELIQINSSTYK